MRVKKRRLTVEILKQQVRALQKKGEAARNQLRNALQKIRELGSVFAKTASKKSSKKSVKKASIVKKKPTTKKAVRGGLKVKKK